MYEKIEAAKVGHGLIHQPTTIVGTPEVGLDRTCASHLQEPVCPTAGNADPAFAHDGMSGQCSADAGAGTHHQHTGGSEVRSVSHGRASTDSNTWFYDS